MSEEEEEERELKEFTSVAHKITNFLCFAIDKTVSLDSVEATADRSSPRYWRRVEQNQG